MNSWHNLLGLLPLSESWMHILLFVTFGVHLLFVLLLLGTSLIGFFSFVQERIGGKTGRTSITTGVMRSYLGSKSLAVVLGVGPLLLIQVLYASGFFTATGLFAYAWMAVIPLLICSFLCTEHFAHRLQTDGSLSLFVVGLIGLLSLLAAPLVFTGALSLLERPEHWPLFASQAPGIGDGFTLHWLLRYVHILGAALIVGGVFHLVASGDDEAKAEAMKKWILAGLVLQLLGGALLLLTLWHRLGVIPLTALSLALPCIIALLLASLERAHKASTFLLTTSLLVLVLMLAVRQELQDQPAMALRTASQARMATERSRLATFQPQALADYEKKLTTVYDSGATIYTHSCVPCHGEDGRGSGPAASRLLIPAEDLSAVQAHKPYLRQLLLTGVPGSAMPYFSFLDKNKINALLTELDQRFATFSPEQAERQATGNQAQEIWATVCTVCHGTSGEISDFGARLQPAPPDLRHFRLTRERAYQIITKGYPGTVMQPYAALPHEVRTDLATIASGLYEQ